MITGKWWQSLVFFCSLNKTSDTLTYRLYVSNDKEKAGCPAMNYRKSYAGFLCMISTKLLVFSCVTKKIPIQLLCWLDAADICQIPVTRAKPESAEWHSSETANLGQASQTAQTPVPCRVWSQPRAIGQTKVTGFESQKEWAKTVSVAVTLQKFYQDLLRQSFHSFLCFSTVSKQ